MTKQTAGTLVLPGLDAPRIEGTVRKVVYADIARGFSILRVETGSGVVTVAGRGDAVALGDCVRADGQWETHPRHGRQFKARFISAEVPRSGPGLARYIASGAIGGVGPRTADKLLATFGDQLPSVLQSATLIQGADVPERKAKVIAEHFTLRDRHKELQALLMSHDLGPATAKKIIDHYGDDTLRVVTTQPYKLARDVHGIGFKKADQIALSQRIGRDAPERVRAGVLHQLQQLQREGHCAAPRDVIRQEAAKLLLVQDHTIDREIDRLLEDGEFVADRVGAREVIYDKRTREREIAVADLLTERARADFDLTRAAADLDALVGAAASAVGIQLHGAQAQAVRIALASGACAITGGPGTGKTSTLKTFIAAYEQLMGADAKVVLAAPTGRAAKRMTEATGREARTLHRLLGWTAHARGEGGGGREIEATALVVDESSMMDLYITHEVLRALPDSCRLILVGDADQLPSVGAGNVLADIVASGAIPVARLSQIFRQSEGSSIADAAREINDGRVPSLTDPRHSSDMWQVAVSEPAEAADKVVKLMSDVLPRIGWDPLSQVQVLTPGHAHDTGTISLNERLQAALNPPSPQTAELTHARKTFRVGDRVIQTTNNYDLEVFNGDIGNVVGVTAAGDDPQLLVDFDGHQAVYRRSDMDELQLAYAISIHKSQGSEFPVVVCALTTQHYVMLRRNLVYTAVTRARKLCAVVGQKQALATAVRRDGGHRITGLAGRLAGRALTHDAGVTGPAPDARPDPEEIF